MRKIDKWDFNIVLVSLFVIGALMFTTGSLIFASIVGVLCFTLCEGFVIR